VIRPGGVVFVTVPIVDRCWDAGRSTTPLQHFIEGYRLYTSGEAADLPMARERNREHYIEFIDIFDRNARGKTYVKPSVQERQRLSYDVFGKRRNVIGTDDPLDILRGTLKHYEVSCIVMK
jgi:hypothetical protein